jgi:hypothetical protein
MWLTQQTGGDIARSSNTKNRISALGIDLEEQREWSRLVVTVVFVFRHARRGICGVMAVVHPRECILARVIEMACSSRLCLSRCHKEGCNAPGETAPCYVTTLPCKRSLPKLPIPQQRHSAAQIVPGPGCDRVKGLLDLQSLPAVVGGFPCIVSPRRRFLGCEMVQGKPTPRGEALAERPRLC